jgi:hypothetical protein
MGSRLADVDPVRNVDLFEIELEQRIVRHGLDHPADSAALDDSSHQSPRRRVVDRLERSGANAEFVVVRSGQCVDGAAGVSTEVPSLR